MGNLFAPSKEQVRNAYLAKVRKQHLEIDAAIRRDGVETIDAARLEQMQAAWRETQDEAARYREIHRIKLPVHGINNFTIDDLRKVLIRLGRRPIGETMAILRQDKKEAPGAVPAKRGAAQNMWLKEQGPLSVKLYDFKFLKGIASNPLDSEAFEGTWEW